MTMLTTDHMHVVTVVALTLDAVGPRLTEALEELHAHAREAAAGKTIEGGPLWQGRADQISHSVTVLPRSADYPQGGFLITAAATVTVFPNL